MTLQKIVMKVRHLHRKSIWEVTFPYADNSVTLIAGPCCHSQMVVVPIGNTFSFALFCLRPNPPGKSGWIDVDPRTGSNLPGTLTLDLS